MDTEQDNQYAMTTVLVKFIADNRAAIKASKVADTEASDILTAYAKLTPAVGAAPLSTKENTKAATAARKELFKVLPVI